VNAVMQKDLNQTLFHGMEEDLLAPRNQNHIYTLLDGVLSEQTRCKPDIFNTSMATRSDNGLVNIHATKLCCLEDPFRAARDPNQRF